MSWSRFAAIWLAGCLGFGLGFGTCAYLVATARLSSPLGLNLTLQGIVLPVVFVVGAIPACIAGILRTIRRYRRLTSACATQRA
jgi:hypothetical protein